MPLPPGVVYLLQHLPYFAIPSALTYIILTIVQHQTGLIIPQVSLILTSILARPIIYFLDGYYSEWKSKRAAAANGAVLAPWVHESSFTLISSMGEAFRTGYPADIYHQWSKKYGNTYRFNLMNTKLLATSEPEHIKAVLATQFSNFDKGPTLISQLSSLLGTGVFNSDGEMWKFHRAMSRPFFSRERISDFHIYERNCTMSLQMAKKRLAEGYSIDFQDLVARFTLDSATEFLFGGCAESISAPMPYPSHSPIKNEASVHGHPSSVFTDAFMDGLTTTVQRINLGDAWPLTELTTDTVAPFRKTMDDFIEPLMQKALDKREQELINEKSEKESEEETFIDHLVKHTQDPTVIKDEIVNLLLAGRDTTMCLLSFAVYMLAEHPDIERRLREEIYEKVGPSESPSYSQMREMKYMRAFLNETLRLYPPVPADSRVNSKPVILPPTKPGEKPIYVSANTTIIYSPTNMQRRTDLWGPDALKFDPDRFLDERVKKYYTANPFIFAPFNAGPRICIGQQFAYHEATFYLVRLLQQFTGFELDQTANTPTPAAWASGDGLKATEKIYPLSHLTMYIKGGLWLRMKELKGTNV